MPNIVYVLTNPAMQEMVKIGMTDRLDVQSRMKELSSASGVPLPFECVIAWEVEERRAKEVENALHIAFGPARVNESREFFRIEPEQAEALLRVMPGRDVTPSVSEQEVEIQSEEREAFTRWNRTSEQEFVDSLDANGVRAFDRILPLGNQDDMRIKWGSKGFSLNAISNDALVVVCYGYPPHSPKRGQSIYTELSSMTQKSNVPQSIVDHLRTDALETSLFETAGGSGAELRCRIDRRLSEDELSILTSWLQRVIGYIREFENSNDGEVPKEEEEA